MSEEDRILVQKRAAIKSQLTRFKGYLEKWAERPNEQQLIERLAKIKATWSSFEDVQSSIELLDIESENSVERAVFEETYFDLVARAQRRLAALRAAAAPDNVPASAALPVTHGVTTNIKLPTINLPVFSGKYEAWLGFYDNFRSIVHDNESLTPVQKLQYLRSSLTDDAAQVIQSLETSSQNYEVAWALMVERYDNRRIIIQSHVRALFELPGITKESASQLRSLVDAALKHMRALQALGQPTGSWGALLFHLITSKFDRNTHKEWERSLDGSEMPQIEDFWKFLKNRCHVLENVSQETSSQSTKGQARSNNPRVNVVQTSQQTLVAAHTKIECALCRQGHNIFHCEQFLKLNRDSRSAKVKSLGLCYNCLRPNHMVSDCKSGTCRKCKRKHHTLLHFESESTPQGSTGSGTVDVKPQASLQAIVTSHVLLSTASIVILGKGGEPIECRALLDSGSQSNFLTERLCKCLNLSKREVNIPVSGFNQSLTRIRHSVKASVRSKDGRFKTELPFLVVSRITEALPAQAVDRRSLDIPKNITLADPNFCNSSEIDALIGAELFYHLLCVGQIRLNNTALILQKTRLGWIVSGTIRGQEIASSQTACNLAIDSLNARVAEFWEAEEIPSGRHVSCEGKECEGHFAVTHSRDPSGRYIVRLPFNNKRHELGDSYQGARKRLYSLERRLAQDIPTYEEYARFLGEYKKLGHMTEVTGSEATEGGYFIPHHPVFKRDSHTTKLRVVFDASSKTTSGISLNDVLVAGPTIQEDLFSIVTRFRTHRYVLSADVEKMYRQVLLHPDDVKFQKILWREGQDEPIETFQLNTVTYGTGPASFLVTRALLQLSIDEREQFPLASQVIREDVYVDDILTGTSSLEDAERLRDELIDLLERGGFHLRQWCSNEPSLLEKLHEKSVDPHICLNESETQKTLGIHWQPRDDELVHLVRPFDKQRRTTKRTMLSQVASLFDPLGLLGPIIVKAKIMLQRL